jgi:ABC-type nickel/cobalt efflux system permease component RcnA
MAVKKIPKVGTEIVFVAALLLFLPQFASADPTWMPILKINGQFPDAYSLQGMPCKFYMPQGEYQGAFPVGKKIDLKVDTSWTGLYHLVCTIHTGGGHTFKTDHVEYAYDKPGSYIATVHANQQTGMEDVRGNIDAVLINIVPRSNYRLPQAKISVEGKMLAENDITPYKISAGKTVRFDARASLSGTSKIVKYQWDFGDGKEGSGISVMHRYVESDMGVFVVLRVTDQNGLFNDTYLCASIIGATLQQPGKETGGNITQITTPAENERKTGIAGRFYAFYRNVNVWLIQRVSGGISTKSIFLILLISAFLGSLHSLTPGHSKSIMAAVLIADRQSRAKDVFLLATAITFTHTILIYAMGLFLLVLDKTASLNRIMPYITKLNIVLVIFLGLWLIGRGAKAWRRHHRYSIPAAAAGKPAYTDEDTHEHHHAHVHDQGPVDGHHGHNHAHPHTHDYSKRSDSLWGAMLAGASGGFVPCIDALSLLVLAASLHMVVFGLAVVFFFSLGLAASIMLLGLLVIRTKRIILINEGIGEKVEIYAALLTGTVIAIIGFVLIIAR